MSAGQPGKNRFSTVPPDHCKFVAILSWNLQAFALLCKRKAAGVGFGKLSLEAIISLRISPASTLCCPQPPFCQAASISETGSSTLFKHSLENQNISLGDTSITNFTFIQAIFISKESCTLCLGYEWNQASGREMISKKKFTAFSWARYRVPTVKDMV